MRTPVKIVFFIAAVFLYTSFPPRAHAAAHAQNASVKLYSRLVRLYERYFLLEEDSFAALTFKLAERQLVKTGYKFKLTLVDNHGEYWIFKEKRGINPVVAHRIYALFGVENQEIHAVEIILNGKPVKGILQKYVSPASTLDRHKLSAISPGGLNYLVKTQLLDWLMQDYDSTGHNVLVLSFDSDNRIDQVMRIDQDCACLDATPDNLDYSGMVATRNRNGKKFGQYSVYSWLRQAYAQKKTALDLARAYEFVKFIEHFPEPLFETTVWKAKTGRTDEPGKEEVAALEKKYAFFWNGLSARKRAVTETFRDFCSGIGLSLDGAARNRENPPELSLILSVCDKFKKQISALTLIREKGGIETLPARKPIVINATASPEGFKIIKEFYKLYWEDGGELQDACRSALRALRKLRSGAPAREKKAIDIYIADLRNILRGEKVRFHPTTVIGMVDPAL